MKRLRICRSPGSDRRRPSRWAAALNARLMVVVVGGVLGMAGCKEDRPPAKPEIKPYAGQKVTVMASSAHIIAFRSLAAWFQEETGGIVEIKEVPYMDLKQYILKDQAQPVPAVDVYQSFYYQIGELAAKGCLADLTRFIAENEASIHTTDFFPNLYQAYTCYDDRRWGLPWDGDTHALFYRKSLLAKHGFAPPQTWEEFGRINHTITAAEKEGAVYGSAMMMATPVFKVTLFLNRLVTSGGGLFDSKHRPALNTPEAVAALTMLLDQASDAMPTALKTDFEVGVNAFVSGHVAMEEGWLCLSQMSENPDQSTIRGDWGVVPLPIGTGPRAGQGSTLNAGYVLGISSKSPHLEIAKAYLLFATRKDIQLRGCLTYGSGLNPVRQSVVADPAYATFTHGANRVEQEALANAVAWPTGPQSDALIDVLADNIALAMKRTKSPQQALDDAQKTWERLLLRE